ncbi:MAG TPA: hypothetical protein VGJ92_14000 [Methanocella sp.]|jgi:hypothetical protein
MSNGVGTVTASISCHSISPGEPRKLSFPVDYYEEMPIGRLSTGVHTAYIADAGDPESVRCLDHGRHKVCGGRHVLALESSERLFIWPDADCVLEYFAGKARLVKTGPATGTVRAGMKKMSPPAIDTGTGIEALFRAVSFICSLPGETSPYRSHPLFRSHPPDIRLSSDRQLMPPASPARPIRLWLPPDLRYLYAAAPLAYYLGASVETGEEPLLKISGKSIGMPSGYDQFERWAGKMLSRTFQADCAARCQATTGNRLPGIDVQEITGYSPEELMLMTMPDRFRVYTETAGSGSRAFNQWHMASYVDPVPSSIEILPFLMRSLSAIYAPKSTRVSERDVVSLSVRDFKTRQTGHSRGETADNDEVILPSLHNAQTQHWFSDGCPVDATLSTLGALKNGRHYARDRLMPAVCVICNEPSMAKEAYLLEDLLGGIANVEIRQDLGRADLLHTFSEGFDIVHYAGHCDRSGVKCRDGYADLSSVDTCDVPVFFLNSCSSYLQGFRLIEKGSVCGIATMFRLLDEAAVDVCASFYRMLSRGYPIMTSYLGARECSVTGKEYLLIGDGFYKVFNGRDSFLPFYKLSRNGLGFSLQCKMPGNDKGLIFRTGNGRALADTGFAMTCLEENDLPELSGGLDGMCLYGSCVYDNVADAVNAALIDLRQNISIARAKRMATGSYRPGT